MLKNLIKKRLFKSTILNENDQKDLINSIEWIENFKGNLNDSDISFIKKMIYMIFLSSKSFFNSPFSNISFTISQPPINSFLT